MKFTKLERKQLFIFGLIAYGLTYLLGFVMWYGYENLYDLSVFPNAQMMYPAAGVILAVLITEKGKGKIPKRFFVTFLITTGLMVILALGSVLSPYHSWALWVQLVLIAWSVLGMILLLTEKKEKRAAYGLLNRNWKKSVFCVVLFVLLYFLRTAIAYGISEQIAFMEIIALNPNTWITIAVMPLNFFLVFFAFFGEEYGWRYFLQPKLQKRFGPVKGVLFLGVLWGIWHLPINFFYYSPGYGLQSAAGQQITCITLGIFFAYAYMKTQNIWVPVILHFLNNNLVPVITGAYSANILENQVVTWESLLPGFLLNGLVFGGFLFSKQFRKKQPREIPEHKGS